MALSAWTACAATLMAGLAIAGVPPVSADDTGQTTGDAKTKPTDYSYRGGPVPQFSPPLAKGEKVRERGYVSMVTDGDTFRLGAAPSRRVRNYKVVRLVGVQAPERVARHAPGAQCGGADAYQELTVVAEGYPVVLASMRKSTNTIRGRLLRTAYIYAQGRWVDLAAHQLSHGWGQWMPRKEEPAHNRAYRNLYAAAVNSRVNMWNPTFCGDELSPGAVLRVLIQPDPVGNDQQNLNGEYVQLFNDGVATVDVSGWAIRDSSLETFQFPSGTAIAPGGSVKLHVGSGTATSSTFYWGRKRAAFANPDSIKRYVGDGVWVVDPQGNTRAQSLYPCETGCYDMRQDAITIAKVRYDPPGNELRSPNREWVKVRNRSAETLSMVGYKLTIGGLAYEFRATDTMTPGQTLKIRMGKGKPKGNTRFFKARHAILDNGGDSVAIRRFDGHRITSYSWRKGKITRS
ncbi:MAG: lamin tail domain-containing protein [Candidatus Nanopelagicales bacterium]